MPCSSSAGRSSGATTTRRSQAPSTIPSSHPSVRCTGRSGSRASATREREHEEEQEDCSAEPGRRRPEPADERLGEVRAAEAAEPGSDPVLDTGQRPGERGEGHDGDRRDADPGHDQRPRTKREAERKGEERQRGDQEPRARALASEREVVPGVVRKEEERDDPADEGLRTPPRPVQERQSGHRRKRERRHDQQALLRHEEREGRTGIREADAVEPFGVRADDGRPASRGRLQRVRVPERPRRAERPGVEGGERQDADDEPAGVRRGSTDRPGPERGVDPEHDRDDGERELDDDRQAGEHAGRGEQPSARSCLALEEQDDERREAERSREDVVEVQRRERQQQGPRPEQHRRRQPVPRHDPLDHEEHEQEQDQHRQHGTEEAQLPDPVPIAGLGPGRSVLESRRAQRPVPRQREHREPGCLRRVVAAVDVRGVDRLARVDLRRPGRERPHEREVRRLVRPAVLHDDRRGERQGGEREEGSRPRSQRTDHRLMGVGHPAHSDGDVSSVEPQV